MNWRGLYTPKGHQRLPKKWTEALRKVGASKEWKAAMEANGLAPFNKVGPDFQSYVEALWQKLKPCLLTRCNEVMSDRLQA